LSRRLPIKLLRRAKRQIAAASAWWKVNRTKAPEAFDEEIEKAFDLLAFQPNAGIRIVGGRFAEVRRIHLNRVHYYLYYRPTEKAVEILALWHTSRGSDPIL
jgi:plasmid stabilization system protein ParE